MNERAKQLLKIVLSLALAIISFLLESNKIISTILYIIAYMIVGYEIVLKALKNIFKGKVFDENFLMTVATMGALCIGEIEEAIAVMILYQLGELFQSYAVDKSRKSISELMDIRPDTANILRDDRVEKVSPDEVNIHELILVKPGEKIPLDGIVVEGESMLDTHALTGESVPKSVRVNDEVSSGCINNDGTLKIKVTKEFGESTVSKILDLVENATNKKAKSENFIAKFSRVYTPIVVVLAVLLAVIPPIFIENSSFSEWIYRALSFLVVSCPCALVISIPLSFFGGIGACSKIGVLIKGSNYLEALANAKIVVCDKTGTLTEGIFEVQKIDAIGYSSDTLLEYATSAECFSNHPISLSLKRSYNRKIDCKVVTNAKEKSGHGVSAVVDGKKVLVGNEKLMEEYNVEFKTREDVGTIIYVAIDGIFAGTILIADRIKDDSYRAIESFRKNGIEKIVMLTGDSSKIGTYVAEELKLDEYHAELLPEDKVAWIEKMMAQKRPNDRLVFIGDGINDAPVLALSDIGVAMGGLGSDAAIEAADIVIMNDEPSKLSNSIHISKKTMRVVRENIVFAIAVKLSVLVLSAFGMATMWASVFADVGVSILAIINALRILKIKR